jgi:hypothetical protein
VTWPPLARLRKGCANHFKSGMLVFETICRKPQAKDVGSGATIRPKREALIAAARRRSGVTSKLLFGPAGASQQKVTVSILGFYAYRPEKVQSDKLRPGKTDILMLKNPRTLGSVAPELLSHSFAPHFGPFFGIFTAKNSRCNNQGFCFTYVWNGPFRSDRQQTPS